MGSPGDRSAGDARHGGDRVIEGARYRQACISRRNGRKEDSAPIGIGPSPPGLVVPVDLEVLVDAIRVSPSAPEWFSDLVKSVCDRYGREKPVVQFSLAGQPVS
jgi:hypothetical protein